MKTCPLCHPENEIVLYRNDLFRIIQVKDKRYPVYFRLILNEHLKEMTELGGQEAQRVFATLLEMEQVIRDVANPDKVNWAQLGNMVPHVHWHVIARYADDAAFPDSIWSSERREVPDEVLDLRSNLADRCADKIRAWR